MCELGPRSKRAHTAITQEAARVALQALNLGMGLKELSRPEHMGGEMDMARGCDGCPNLATRGWPPGCWCAHVTPAASRPTLPLLPPKSKPRPPFLAVPPRRSCLSKALRTPSTARRPRAAKGNEPVPRARTVCFRSGRDSAARSMETRSEGGCRGWGWMGTQVLLRREQRLGWLHDKVRSTEDGGLHVVCILSNTNT